VPLRALRQQALLRRFSTGAVGFRAP
jgi:hypothetical protein